MKAWLLRSGIPILDFLENLITRILISQKRIDLRRVFALVKGCIMPFDLSFVVKQSIFCAASLVDFDDHDI